MQRAFKRVTNGKELLEWLQGLSEEELALPLARTDNAPDYGPFYDAIDEVEISKVSTGGWRGPDVWHIVF